MIFVTLNIITTHFTTTALVTINPFLSFMLTAHESNEMVSSIVFCYSNHPCSLLGLQAEPSVLLHSPLYHGWLKQIQQADDSLLWLCQVNSLPVFQHQCSTKLSCFLYVQRILWSKEYGSGARSYGQCQKSMQKHVPFWLDGWLY